MTQAHDAPLDSSRDGAPVLELRGITKFYGAVRALTDVDLTVAAGEAVALVGDNGAGKSTLIKVVSGVEQPAAGGILFEGRPVTVTGAQDAATLGIATVYQDLALCDNLDVVANLFLGRERVRGGPPGVVGWMAESEMERRAVDLLDTLAVRLPDVRMPVASLSGGQRQSVAIARSLLGEPKVVLLDEPTAALGVAQTAQVLDMVVRLKQRGHAVVVISHNLADVFAVCDRVVVLRHGRNNGSFVVAEATPEMVVAAITGADAGSGTGARAGRRVGLPAGHAQDAVKDLGGDES
ncbi:ATP-binding cassette domain-containing protein [Spongiactinospora sp. TRM90649]|uniref:ATP-binding cassette domain-containing protein n=1 Tax=Spongiactinospora sp. TRM90649 TaxID=3031114 RepID=UPI0023F8DD1A|nr:ATP-binding cassette domain-containing protein [Spongiactinospora sp. TRM90649]MDF5753609.1 ATP-binding cassette domain-containing protein [Spongiactinospora sp. TRM90649]